MFIKIQLQFNYLKKIQILLVQKNSSINEPEIISNDSQKEIVDNKTNNLSKLKK